MSETIDGTSGNNSNTLSVYEQRIINKVYGLCSDCNQPNTGDDWCHHCSSKRFQQNFDKWTSGNEHIDKFIQETQLKVRNNWELIEWIPYNRLRNIQYLAQGGFSIIYKAIWLDGHIDWWDNGEQKWERRSDKLQDDDHENAGKKDMVSPLEKNEERGLPVVLKSLNNSSNIHEDFLNEWKNHLQFIYSANSNNNTFRIPIYGITQDPKTLNYMVVLDQVQMGDLRSNLMIKKYNPNDKYHNLYWISKSLLALHECNLIHGDFHGGNILFDNFSSCSISDFGLTRPADQSITSNEIYGVLPYIAPEVLRGKPYTKTADIYSFGIIMWEFTSGIPAFNNIPHDFNLSLKICNGYRPKIVEGTDPDYEELMKRCWNTDSNKRPTAEELYKIFYEWRFKYKVEFDVNKRKQVPENGPIIKNHPSSCYTSRRVDYSARLNELLIGNENMTYKNNNNTMYSESLDDCLMTEGEMELAIQEFDENEEEILKE